MNDAPSAALIRKYDRNGPRYTSYPTALQFTAAFGPEQHALVLAGSREDAPLSVYVHLPFCASPCYYCACTKVITRDPAQGDAYVRRLRREIELQAALLPPGRPITQLHLGGGTPTFLNPAQLEQVLEALGRHLVLDQRTGREFSIEIDPRTVQAETLRRLAAIGFNRASFGIQDFDPAVQRAVNREQSAAQVAGLMDAARHAGFDSLSVDLIYGLPLQTPQSFQRTLDQVIELRPDRISAYSYAHMPRRFVPQRQIRDEQLPPAQTKLELLRLTTSRLLDAGYVHIGMDHFALPGDELAAALADGTLQRNFQGYSTRGGLDLLGLGMSAISRVGDAYSQNARTLKTWNQAIDAGRLAVDRGHALTADDRLRRDVISAIMCAGTVDFGQLEAAHAVAFDDYFRSELVALRGLADDGLVEPLEGATRGFRVTPLGRYLLRAVAMPFDAYLPRAAADQVMSGPYSRVV